MSSLVEQRCCARLRRLRATVSLVAGLAGCSVPVATDLDEDAANEIVHVLGDHGVAAEKVEKSGRGGRFSVDVGRGDLSFALSLMAGEELPSRVPPGLAEALEDGALIPSRADEHARRLLGTAGELSRSLRSVDGVIAAHVHLASPLASPLSPEGTPSEPSASVLLKHRGETPPLPDRDVQRLVAGAVPGLASTGVVVVSQALPAVDDRKGTELVRLGPLTTTRSSLPYLRWMIACVAGLNACMVALLVAMWLRGRTRAVDNPPGATTAPP